MAGPEDFSGRRFNWFFGDVMRALLLLGVVLLVLGGFLALRWGLGWRSRGGPADDEAKYPVLTAAPGMRIKEIVERSTVRFYGVPSDQDERGRLQAKDPTRVMIYHPEHGFEVPAGLFTIVDSYKGIAHTVTATPQLEYLGVDETIALVRRIDDMLNAAKWEWVERPNYDVLPAELPKRDLEVLLGRWTLGSWTADLHVKPGLGPEAAKIAGMERGGFLTTLIVYDEKLWRAISRERYGN